MDSLFAKLIVALSFLLGIASGSLYVHTDTTELSLEYKDGGSYPIIQTLNVENIGPERARFTISSDTPWIFVYKEYETSRTSVEMSPGNIVNFIIEIHPEQAGDGSHSKEVKITAAHPISSEEYEVKAIAINIDKNVVETITPEVTVEPTVTPGEDVDVSPSPTAIIEISPTPAVTFTQTATPIPELDVKEPESKKRSIWLWFWSLIRGELF
jgi:hypothetical protein